VRSLWPIAAAALALGSCHMLPKPVAPPRYEVPAGPRRLDQASPDERFAYLQRAQVTREVGASALDLLAGPSGPGSFAFDQEVKCDFAPGDHGSTGVTPKFYCTLPGGDLVKVKYGADNGEVYGEVAATRLLWALGFGTDHYYPVKVVCRGCPEDPSKASEAEAGSERTFDPAIIERPAAGSTIEVQKAEGGWAWWELQAVDPAQGGASRAEVDALRLLAAFIQHGDNKAKQQRLVCLPEGVVKRPDGSETCSRPFLVVSDLGTTFARADNLNRNKMELDNWSTVPLWRDPRSCRAQLKRSLTGTVGHPEISEAGRRFLADRLGALTDRQIVDIFRAARVERLGERTKAGEVVTAEDWARAFRARRDQLARQRCPR
jgi:hypothetical protein